MAKLLLIALAAIFGTAAVVFGYITCFTLSHACCAACGFSIMIFMITVALLGIAMTAEG